MINVLFVCLGNICRSPTAEGVFRALVEREGLAGAIATDSSGMAAWHVGKSPDERAQATAHARGIELGDLRARQTRIEDFRDFDYIMAMDHDNHADLLDLCPPDHEDRVHMFLHFAPDYARTHNIEEVPDPYYGESGFDNVLDMIEEASSGLLNHIRVNHLR